VQFAMDRAGERGWAAPWVIKTVRIEKNDLFQGTPPASLRAQLILQLVHPGTSSAETLFERRCCIGAPASG